MNYETILTVTTTFYDKAKIDVMIGYHFRFIEDFDEHIPRIANFWFLQLKGKAHDKSQLPFNLLDVHKVLGIKRGEVGRWLTLFEKNLDESIEAQKITSEDKIIWMKKVNHFEEKLKLFLGL